MTGRKAGVALDFVLQEDREKQIAFGKAYCTEGLKGRSVLRQREKDKTEDSQAAFPKSSSFCAENDHRRSIYSCTSGNGVVKEGLSDCLGIWIIVFFTWIWIILFFYFAFLCSHW